MLCIRVLTIKLYKQKQVNLIIVLHNSKNKELQISGGFMYRLFFFNFRLTFLWKLLVIRRNAKKSTLKKNLRGRVKFYVQEY